MNAKAIILAVALLMAGIPAGAQLCGPDVKHSTKRIDGKSPLETKPPADKAVVYVLAPSYEGGGWTQHKVSADRQWIGVNQYHSYFVVALEPGTHDFCSKSRDNASHLKLELEAGKSYFLQQDATADEWFGTKMTRLSQITAEDATHQLKKCKRIIFWAKGSPEPRA